MVNPIAFASTSPRLKFPLLFAGQSQKEVFVNEALSIADALVHCAIEGSAITPPASPVEGTNWLISPGATGDWAGMDGKIACRQAGNWIFVNATDGMSLLNRANGQIMRYSGSWRAPALVVSPSGGTTVDSQARTAIAALIAALQTAGILPAS